MDPRYSPSFLLIPDANVQLFSLREGEVEKHEILPGISVTVCLPPYTARPMSGKSVMGAASP